MSTIFKDGGVEENRGNLGTEASKLHEYLACRSPGLLTAIGCVTVLLVGMIDLVTGAEISVSIFYVIPIAFTTWFAGRMPGLVTAVLSAGIWLAADLATSPGYSHHGIPLWNSLGRLGIFLLVAGQLSSIRNLTGNLEQAVQRKTALLSGEIRARKQLQRELTELTTKQRQGIAHELHDSLCPMLGAIALKAKILQETLARRRGRDAQNAGELVSLLNQATQQARLLARGLDPIAVELHGLTAALRMLAADTEKLFHVSCLFKSELDTLPVCPSGALQLYRIAQEAIQNAVSHGGADCIQLQLLNGASDLRLKIADDGKGFAPDNVSANGMGLRIMRFRAECIGAELRVESSPNRGTTVECCLPNVFPFPPPQPQS